MAILKDDLLNKLEHGKRMEEEIVQRLAAHISTATEWDGIGAEQRDRITHALERNVRESEGHKKILERLIEQIKENEKNVY